MENKKEFSFVFYIIFLLFLLTAGNLKAAPHIEFKKNEIDFGELKQRVRETRFFKFKNTGDDTLKITGIRTTCGCTAAVVSSESIPPGKEGRIEITFSSSTYVGEITRGVKIHTNDPSNRILDIAVKVDVLPPTVRLKIFYLKDCGDYKYIKDKILDPLKKKYKIEMESFDISSPKNYELLVNIEDYCYDRGNRLPIVNIGRSVLGGKDEIEKNLEYMIRDCFRSNCDIPEFGDTGRKIKVKDREIQLVYFYDKEYKKCDRTDYELKYLEEKYPELLILRFDIGDTKNKQLYEDMCDFFEIPEQKKFIFPVVFIGDNSFIKEDIFGKEPEKIIKEFILSEP